MVDIREATDADIPELVRLKGLTMLSWPIEVDLDSDPTWRDRAAAEIARQRATGDLVAFVVDDPSGDGAPGGHLVACLYASLERHIPGPNGNGVHGYLATMCTEPELRGQGIGTAMLQRGLAWLREQGAASVTLYATPSGEALYRRAGFAEPSSPFVQMRMRLD